MAIHEGQLLGIIVLLVNSDFPLAKRLGNHAAPGWNSVVYSVWCSCFLFGVFGIVVKIGTIFDELYNKSVLQIKKDVLNF